MLVYSYASKWLVMHAPAVVAAVEMVEDLAVAKEVGAEVQVLPSKGRHLE